MHIVEAIWIPPAALAPKKFIRVTNVAVIIAIAIISILCSLTFRPNKLTVCVPKIIARAAIFAGSI